MRAAISAANVSVVDKRHLLSLQNVHLEDSCSSAGVLRYRRWYAAVKAWFVRYSNSETPLSDALLLQFDGTLLSRSLR